MKYNKSKRARTDKDIKDIFCSIKEAVFIPLEFVGSFRNCQERTCPFRLVLLHTNFVKKPRRSLGYASVFCLVIAQNNFAYSDQLIS